uniref:Uncharacterized protein n=1 Tax=Oryza brachyantha TaxID=4533 RepID=J3MLR3_ORYBR
MPPLFTALLLLISGGATGWLAKALGKVDYHNQLVVRGNHFISFEAEANGLPVSVDLESQGSCDGSQCGWIGRESIDKSLSGVGCSYEVPRVTEVTTMGFIQ